MVPSLEYYADTKRDISEVTFEKSKKEKLLRLFNDMKKSSQYIKWLKQDEYTLILLNLIFI